jgi:predicted metal-dependent phosphoesterase TrpH
LHLRVCYTEQMELSNDKKIDLHTHTTASDGGLSPTELVKRAVEVGIGILGVTDHDTVAGLAEAQRAARKLGVRIVPGVEFGLDVKGTEVHMLGYFFDMEHPALLGKLAELREGRLHRGERMVEKLIEIGVPITWERVQEIAAGGSVGRPHVGKALVEAGFAETIDDAFEKYLGNGKPAYVPRTQMTLTECIALVHEAGGVAAMAHPTWVEDVEGLLPALVEAGLDGIETYYGRYGPETVAWLAGLAEKYNLVPTGGSDFHGLDSLSHAQIGSMSLPPDCFAELERRAAVR